MIMRSLAGTRETGESGMFSLLQPGQVVQTKLSGLSCTVERFLGGGGQGEVYRADLDGEKVALKWLFPDSATDVYRNRLRKLINQGSPSRRFLWPMDLATARGIADFGYVMPLREERYKDLVDYLHGEIDLSFRALTTIGLNTAESFFALHINGFCYHDISMGNIFFDPERGDVVVCDNDNVGVNGEPGDVLGTLNFMAPEIARGEAHPTLQTDYFSLAVLLFYLFMKEHPLRGRRVDDPDRNDPFCLYGTDPLFIFDPENDANRPDPRYQRAPLERWPIYPQFLRDAFTQTFTTGLRHPSHRTPDSLWRAAMARARDVIFNCAGCGAENFYNADASRAARSAPGSCWRCDQLLTLPQRIRIGDKIVALNPDTQLFPHHVAPGRLYDFSQPVARVAPHPTKPGIWGLTNVSSDRWTIITSQNGAADVNPGQSVLLNGGTKIYFGNMEGEIRM